MRRRQVVRGEGLLVQMKELLLLQAVKTAPCKWVLTTKTKSLITCLNAVRTHSDDMGWKFVGGGLFAGKFSSQDEVVRNLYRLTMRGCEDNFRISRGITEISIHSTN